MERKNIAGLIRTVADGHYRRGLGGRTGGELVYKEWIRIADALDEAEFRQLHLEATSVRNLDTQPATGED